MLTSAARGIRGATVVLSNTAEDIEKATVELVGEILKKNNIKISDIAFVSLSSVIGLITGI